MIRRILEEKHKELAPHFKPGFLQREYTLFQFVFDSNESPFHLVIDSSEFEFVEGTHSSPTITLNVSDHETCWGLLDGRIDGMKAFMEEAYRADGNIVLSQLLLYLFKSNDPTIVYEVQY